MPERVKKKKCGEGGLREKFEGGYDGEGKEDKMRGGGVLRKKKIEGEGYAGEG